MEDRREDPQHRLTIEVLEELIRSRREAFDRLGSGVLDCCKSHTGAHKRWCRYSPAKARKSREGGE